MTMKSDGIMDIAPECFVEISAQDAEKFGVEDGALVDVASRRGAIRARIKISSQAVSGTVFIPFHYAGAAANRLTNPALDPVSGIPELKVCAVKLSKTT
jgi:formate dehydrogenase major subunit/formate dehydrogenase alpha subunit